MQPTSLERLLRTGAASVTANGVKCKVRHSWIIEGEDRLSYTTIIRLVECCREVHWNADVLPFVDGKAPVDCICKAVSATFTRPVLVGHDVEFRYAIKGLGRRGYSLQVQAVDGDLVCGEVLLELVFYDPVAGRSAPPPDRVWERLLTLIRAG